MRPLLIGLAALTAVGGTAIVVNQTPAPPDGPPAVDLPAGVEPFIDRKIVPYEIEGATAEALYASIKEKGPRKGLGRFWAYTEWAVDWHYRFQETASACAIDPESLAVRAAIIQYLPLWKGYAGAAEPLKGNFERFRAALNAHEDLHAQHGIDAAREILAALRTLPAAKTCPEIEAAADAAGKALHEKNRARDAALDARTNGGMAGMPKL
jgi:predicted secreted Zn-dependent protease